MRIFRLKYLLHKLVNLLFYGLVFFLGYMLGGGHYEKVIDMFNGII